ncbi:hypothetical protein CGC21_28015 [Leishmania donovani]|nr:hypothetical protein CGC21_28015 [Leishmania donovani]
MLIKKPALKMDAQTSVLRKVCQQKPSRNPEASSRAPATDLRKPPGRMVSRRLREHVWDRLRAQPSGLRPRGSTLDSLDSLPRGAAQRQPHTKVGTALADHARAFGPAGQGVAVTALGKFNPGAQQDTPACTAPSFAGAALDAAAPTVLGAPSTLKTGRAPFGARHQHQPQPPPHARTYKGIGAPAFSAWASRQRAALANTFQKPSK